MNHFASLLKIRLDEGVPRNSSGVYISPALRRGLSALYIAAGALTFVITMAYSAGLGRFEKGRFLWIISAFAVLLIIERAALALSLPFLYPDLWLTVNGIGGILGTFVWNLAGEVCDARQAKRLFPLFTRAGILGSVLGNAVTGFIAQLLDTDNLFFLYALLLGIGFISLA